MKQVASLLGPFWVWDADYLGQQLAAGTWWDQHLQPALDQADPSGWAIDIGASVGWFTRYLLGRHVGVIAVEAHPGTFDLLARNAPEAVGIFGVAYDRTTSFVRAPDALLGWPSGALEACPNVSSLAFVRTFYPSPIESVVLDEIVGDRRVTLIKSDAQGCDLRALRGLRRTIRRDRPLIVFEFEQAASSWHGDDWEDYAQFFDREHYTVERIREDLWDYVARPE